MELLKKYQARMSEFCKFDDMNLPERAKKVPEEKHFWNTQLVDAHIKLYRMKKSKKKDEEAIREKVLEGSAEVAPTKAWLDERVKEKMSEIDEKIVEQEFLIKWLELNTKTVSFIAQDVKNMVELKKLEEI